MISLFLFVRWRKEKEKGQAEYDEQALICESLEVCHITYREGTVKAHGHHRVSPLW